MRASSLALPKASASASGRRRRSRWRVGGGRTGRRLAAAAGFAFGAGAGLGLGAATGFGLAAATGFDLAAATRFGLAAATGFGLTAGLGIARLTAFFALGFTRFSALFTGFGRGRLVLTVALAFALAAFFFSGLATALERLAGRRAIGFAGFRAAFFTFFWAMQTFSSQESLGTGLTYGGKLTDNRLLSAIPRAATDSLSKLVIRHRAAQEAPELNG